MFSTTELTAHPISYFNNKDINVYEVTETPLHRIWLHPHVEWMIRILN
jgi:hypothetical protein